MTFDLSKHAVNAQPTNKEKGTDQLRTEGPDHMFHITPEQAFQGKLRARRQVREEEVTTGTVQLRGGVIWRGRTTGGQTRVGKT